MILSGADFHSSYYVWFEALCAQALIYLHHNPKRWVLLLALLFCLFVLSSLLHTGFL